MTRPSDQPPGAPGSPDRRPRYLVATLACTYWVIRIIQELCN